MDGATAQLSEFFVCNWSREIHTFLMSRTASILSYGNMHRLATLIGKSDSWTSKVVYGHKKATLVLAERMDATGILSFSILGRDHPRVHLLPPTGSD